MASPVRRPRRPSDLPARRRRVSWQAWFVLTHLTLTVTLVALAALAWAGMVGISATLMHVFTLLVPVVTVGAFPAAAVAPEAYALVKDRGLTIHG